MIDMPERNDAGERHGPLRITGAPGLVRGVRLRRRRSRVPWIYLVYHADRAASRARERTEDRGPRRARLRAGAESVGPPEECRHVEW